MKNLWNDLAQRVRKANHVREFEMPFGFADSVLRKLGSARRQGYSLLDEWAAVLRPAVGLACGAAIICLLLQSRIETETAPNDSLTQTEALFQLAVLND